MQKYTENRATGIHSYSEISMVIGADSNFTGNSVSLYGWDIISMNCRLTAVTVAEQRAPI